MPRHKAYDREDVLGKAMELFWEQGYDGTSIPQLEKRMGINRFSIYDTFGDKQGLFLAAMDRYRTMQAKNVMQPLIEGEGLEAIHGFFRSVAQRIEASTTRMGCLIVNTAAERPDDPESAKKVEQHFQFMEDTFHRALRQARKRGEIGPEGSLRDRARYLAVSMQGVLVSVRMAPDKASLLGALRVLQQEIDTW